MRDREMPGSQLILGASLLLDGELPRMAANSRIVIFFFFISPRYDVASIIYVVEFLERSKRGCARVVKRWNLSANVIPVKVGTGC